MVYKSAARPLTILAAVGVTGGNDRDRDSPATTARDQQAH
jgi:hypothetical protein